MVAIDLSSATVTLKLIRKDSGKTESITFQRGRHKDKLYHRAVVLSGSVVLEGDVEPLCLGNIEAVYVCPDDIRDQIAAMLESEEIYMRGLAAVPEGQERRLIERLLG